MDLPISDATDEKEWESLRGGPHSLVCAICDPIAEVPEFFKAPPRREPRRLPSTGEQLLDQARHNRLTLPEENLSPTDRFIQGVQHLGDAGLLRERWNGSSILRQLVSVDLREPTSH